MCSRVPNNEEIRTYKLQKITGEWITVTYTLKERDRVFLTSEYGGAVLSCICDGHYKKLRPAIIDMELIKTVSRK